MKLLGWSCILMVPCMGYVIGAGLMLDARLWIATGSVGALVCAIAGFVLVGFRED